MAQEVTILVNKLLNIIREKHGLTSDEALSRLLGVSDMAIYRWRRGQIDKSTKVLLPQVLKYKAEIEIPA